MIGACSSTPFTGGGRPGNWSPPGAVRVRGQYRHFEAALPDVLETVARGPGGPRRPGARAGQPLRRAGSAVVAPLPVRRLLGRGGGSTSAEATPATEALVDLYRDRSLSDPVGALAGLAAYEVQAPQIASSKADGLRSHYGVSPRGTRFWDVHGVMDERHGAWSLDALEAVARDEDAVRRAARQAADVWWSFLDEREQSRTAAIGQPA